ncbi:uncharacterized protein BX664DRAFT_328392 [Halteromyces radiatus]|uniref:uncharacterized protein n=1 Tax=Halteromyces radiatus TaxID=101107 RepID=UPI0022205DC4|nr:uncharacterized protein BX664DRAFT_328392 [Halteromyces radiatus]KAI8092882.1 hypothetical protein BX664DRAFT_328392 [Halteromyces radiatus]
MSLYDKLLHALTHYPIDELGILPCAPNLSEIPSDAQQYYPLLVVGCKLGFSFDQWMVLLKETQELFNDYRLHHFEVLDMTDTLEQLTRVMVLLKPDNYTAMNIRKQMVVRGQVSIPEELKLIELMFTIAKHTKSSIAWYHRQWLFTFNNKQHMNDMDMEREIQLCQRCITLHPRNYYAWNYRQWLVALMIERDNGILQQEYHSTCQWMEKNISDHTGIRHLEFILDKWMVSLSTSSSIQSSPQGSTLLSDHHHQRQIIQSHVAWLTALLLRYPGHESLWCHQRFCATLWFQYRDNDKQWTDWANQQHRFIQQILDNENEQHQSLDLSNYQQQLGFSSKYGLWLCFMK